MRVLVTGGDGLVGSAVRRAKPDAVYTTHGMVDLTDREETAALFEEGGPFDAVIHTAAFVGGIGQQVAHPFDLVHQNLLMNCNVIEQCVKHKVKRLLAFSSVCAMPDPGTGENADTLVEGMLHDDQPPQPNWHYGYAKRMVDVLIDGAMKQHGARNWCSVIPVNIYGPSDNYRLGVCHVVPALIHKLYNAKREGKPLQVWGTGSAIREFLYVDDLAKVLLRLLDLPEVPQRLIVSPSVPTTVHELVSLLCHVNGFEAGKVEWDRTKPDGQHARPTDTSLLKRLLPDIEWTPLRDGLKASYEWFATNYEGCRK